MEILIVEDSIVFRNAIKNKIEKNLLFATCSSVTTFEELIEEKDYDIYICDYNLPDAPNGEHIEYLLRKNKDVIVVTKFEAEFMDSFIKDKVLEYLIKDDNSMLDYLVKFVRRINRNKNLNILVVEDSLSVRNLVMSILDKLKLNIFEAKNGCEALNILENKNIDLIITDLTMPQMSGKELIKKVRKKKKMSELPIVVISSLDDNTTFLKALKLGANDYLKKPFLKEELIIRVNNLLDLYDSFKKINSQLQKDPLTGVYNRFFLENVLENMFNMYEKKSIAMLDIDFFKKINDTYGHQHGDKVLKDFANNIKGVVRKSDIVVRYGGEEFLIFMPNTSKEEGFIALLKIKEAIKKSEFNYTFSGGIADEGETLAEMIKIADNRLYNAKKEGRNKIIFK
jgi:diguanylate cyclase (GGDEF)-like protein